MAQWVKSVAVQALKFESPGPEKKQGWASIGSLHPALCERGTGWSLGLIGQPAHLKWQDPNSVRLSQEKKMESDNQDAQHLYLASV